MDDLTVTANFLQNSGPTMTLLVNGIGYPNSAQVVLSNSTGGPSSQVVDLSSYSNVYEVTAEGGDLDFALSGVPVIDGVLIGDQPNDSNTSVVLQPSVTGTQNLVPLHLFVPDGLTPGTQVTLSISAPSEVDVWNSDDPQAGSTPLLGGNGDISTATMTVGTDTIPSTLWVGATQSASGASDNYFTLDITSPGALTPTTANTVPVPANPLAQIQIKSNSDPNNPVTLNQNISGQKNITWVVGQNVDLIAQLPAPVQNPMSFIWTVNGPTDFSYVQTPGANGTAVDTQLKQNNAGGTGTGDQEIKFFWTGPGVWTVTLTATNGGVQLPKDTVTFDVIAPAATFNGTPSSDANPVMVGTNARVDGQGNPVQAFTYGDFNSPAMTYNASVTASNNAELNGQFEIVQLVDATFTLTYLIGGNTATYNTQGYLIDDRPEPFRFPMQVSSGISVTTIRKV
jgi:hypothetical protein